MTRTHGHDAGIEHMLQSWIYLDNHDTPRLATTLPDVAQRRLAQVLQFTLPGAPNLYYGSELGMTGGDDPEMRAPMRWDLAARRQPRPAVDAPADRPAPAAPRAAGGRLPPGLGRAPDRLRAPYRPGAETVVVLANPSNARSPSADGGQPKLMDRAASRRADQAVGFAVAGHGASAHCTCPAAPGRPTWGLHQLQACAVRVVSFSPCGPRVGPGTATGSSSR
jgi:hypothetical protein